RAALHTGPAEHRNGDYFGVELSRVGRLLSAGHGGQTLVSKSTKELAQDALPKDSAFREMGTHRLKDLSRLEEVFQLDHPGLESEFPALKTLDNRPNNLPRQRTSFIGREKEMDDLEALFAKTALLTLTGVGGTGKTRLATQFAADQLDSFKDGVWFVDLAPVSDPDFVPGALAEAIGYRQDQGKTMAETLIDRLREKKALVVLDNCEHLLDACTAFAETLIHNCRGLKIIATSRESLGVAGELIFHVQSLSVPDPKKTAGDIGQYESVRLFAERAQFAKPGFEIGEGNAVAVASVCARLEGIPLAIELAAARVRSMTPQDVNERLDHRFRLLTSGAKTALKRQQTLQGLIDWSYDLLDEKEKAVLQRLSVFRGGWYADSAEKVCSDELVDESDVLDVLSSLVSKSLVVSEESSGRARYRMLETVREYAAEKLERESDLELWRRRHARYFADLADEAESHFMGGDRQQEFLDRFDTDLENVRTALDWALVDGLSREDGVRTVGALLLYWDVRALFAEARNRALDLIGESPEATKAVSRATYAAGWASYRMTDYEGAVMLYERSRALSESIGDDGGQVRAFNGLASTAWSQGDLDRAASCFESSLVLARKRGDEKAVRIVIANLAATEITRGNFGKAAEMLREVLEQFRRQSDANGEARVLSNLGEALFGHGDLEGAREAYSRAIDLSQTTGNTLVVAVSGTGLGNVLCELGEYEKARDRLSSSLAVCMETGEAESATFALESFVEVLAHEGRPRDGAKIAGASTASRERAGSVREVLGARLFAKHVAFVRNTIGNSDFDSLFDEGRKLSLEDAVKLVLQAGVSD
ncbi:MAG TPA: tetratricopeptide repeat protein, partial [Fimbriimonadaceae bacterium]|nr:tetratricopeptide repeat protein [Fimbriimonadaceae bacterium]